MSTAVQGERVREQDDAWLAALVEDELARQLALDPPAMREPMEELVGAGGKRLRPLLAMLCARLGPAFDPGRSARLAACIELIHSATLVHDDVIDASALRRGRPTVGSSRGNRAAVAVGDYYFARAAAILAELGQANVTATVLAGIRRVCASQISEMHNRLSHSMDADAYLEVAAGKTAALLVAACVGGAQLTGAGEAAETALAEYASALGLAFQMVDDVIDFEGGTGKPVGQDLRAGVPSLPVILAAQVAGPGSEAMSVLADPERVEEAVAWVRSAGVLEGVRERALALGASAVAALQVLPPSDSRERLRELALGAATRRS